MNDILENGIDLEKFQEIGDFDAGLRSALGFAILSALFGLTFSLFDLL